MKKLICAALVAGSMIAVAEEAATCEAGACKAPVAVAEGVKKPGRPQLTAEQKAELKAKREKFMAERKAMMDAKLLEVAKKYVPEEDKAKALVEEFQAAMKMSMRPPRPPRPPKKAEEKAQ